jgi:hypothetical protein
VQVAEHAGAQPVHDPLADDRGDPGLHHAERAGQGGHADHAGDQPDQQGQVGLGQGHVDDLAQQERLRHADDRRGDDEGGDDRDGGAVLAEQGRDAAQRDGLRLSPVGRRDGGGAAAAAAGECAFQRINFFPVRDGLMRLPQHEGATSIAGTVFR